MLSSITLKNLKCFDDSVVYAVPLTKETAIAGPNNAGKSVIFTAVNLLRFSWNGHGNAPQYNTDYYRLGTYNDLVHKHVAESLVVLPLDVLNLCALEPTAYN
jgi:AAA15 family ATPase/GTPase